MAMDTQSPPNTQHTLRGLARELAPAIGGRAARAEADRRIPRESIDEMAAAGLTRIQRPRRWGGHELGFEAAFDVAVEIGKACGSTAWCLSFLNHHDWMLGMFPEEAQAEVWDGHPEAAIASSLIPAGRLHRGDGGWWISGEWPWASGVDHCTWTLVGGLDHSAAEPVARLFAVPRAQFTIVDTWRNVGLRGTGSNNVLIKDEIFIPEHRMVPVAEMREGIAPGGKVNVGTAYRVPLAAGFALGLTAPGLGIAQGAYEQWRDWTSNRVGSYSPQQVAEQSPTQINLGVAAARIDAAELLLRANMQRLAEPARVTMIERTVNRRNYSYATQLLCDAIDTLLLLSGARGLLETNSIQRAWRDVHSMAAHTGLNPNAANEAYGRLELGLERNPNDPLF